MGMYLVTTESEVDQVAPGAWICIASHETSSSFNFKEATAGVLLCTFHVPKDIWKPLGEKKKDSWAFFKIAEESHTSLTWKAVFRSLPSKSGRARRVFVPHGVRTTRVTPIPPTDQETSAVMLPYSWGLASLNWENQSGPALLRADVSISRKLQDSLKQ